MRRVLPGTGEGLRRVVMGNSTPWLQSTCPHRKAAICRLCAVRIGLAADQFWAFSARAREPRRGFPPRTVAMQPMQPMHPMLSLPTISAHTDAEVVVRALGGD